ncbi:MAG: FecR family protein [Mangrovibacterium sp.]
MKILLDHAMLILADGEKISISSKQSTVKYSSDGSGIMVDDSSGIAQSVSDHGLNQMIVPFGKRSYIMLSEGTQVWLNSGSRLVFSPIFKGKNREVFLEGEAFFDVAEDKEHPFYVKTDAFKMKVYGTKFNVQAYQQDKDYTIVLVEGKVSLNTNKSPDSQEVFLSPNQKASILSKDGERFEITNIENPVIYTAWIDGYLTFTNEDVSEVLKRVSRYYNVEIDVELPENIERIYGKLDLKDDLERVLDGIAFISKTKYKKQGNKYVFYESSVKE